MNNVNLVNHTQLATSIEAERVLAAAPVKAALSKASLKSGAADSLVVFNTSGKRIVGFSGNSISPTAAWLMGFDAASLPSVGTRPDMPGIGVAAYGDFSGAFDDDGLSCATGWVFALSSTQNALTVTTGSYLSILATYRVG